MFLVVPLNGWRTPLNKDNVTDSTDTVDILSSQIGDSHDDLIPEC